MIEEWHTSGMAEMTFVPATRDPDGPDYDDAGSLELIVPIDVRVIDDTNSAAQVNTTLFIALSELFVYDLEGLVKLDGVADESSLYALDRHQEVSVRHLVLQPGPDGYRANMICDIDMPAGRQRLQLEVRVGRAGSADI